MPKRKILKLASRMSSWKKAMARRMARHQTWPEKILWSRIRDAKLGVRFYKQKPLMGYIVDFWCPRAALVVEVDGPYHLARKEYDANRDVVLMGKGILTMRFTAQTVQNNTAAVIALIFDKIRKRMA
jgi:very-short-patch-repair endonuclease